MLLLLVAAKGQHHHHHVRRKGRATCLGRCPQLVQTSSEGLELMASADEAARSGLWGPWGTRARRAPEVRARASPPRRASPSAAPLSSIAAARRRQSATSPPMKSPLSLVRLDEAVARADLCWSGSSASSSRAMSDSGIILEAHQLILRSSTSSAPPAAASATKLNAEWALRKRR